jgi:hypothetical protein
VRADGHGEVDDAHFSNLPQRPEDCMQDASREGSAPS